MSQIHPLPQAKWIWPRHTLYLHNSYAGFRRDFTLKKLPSAAPLVITADQAYKLHVNGRYVCRGPARSVQEHWFFDVPDILPFLKTGHNWIAVEAHNPGMNTYSYVHRGAAGMLCSADWDDGTQFWSDTKDWIIFRNTAYAPDTARVSVQLGCMEELDLRFDDRSWITEEKDFRLPPAMPGISGAAMRQDALPWTELHPRPVSMLEEKILAPERITCSGTGACARLPLRAPGQIVSTTADFIDLEFGTIDWDPTPLAFSRDDGGLSFTLPAAGQGRFAVASLDLGADDWLPGVPVLELGEHDPGTVLDIFYDQWMKGGKLNFPLHPAKGCLIAMASRLHLNGTTRRTELFQIMGVRHVTLLVRENTRPLDIRLSWRSAVSPMPVAGGFSCADKTLDDIHRISVHTQRVCTIDAFTDTPWREQSQWWGDARVQAKNVFYLTGDPSMLARGIRTIAAQKNPFGITFANAPTSDCGPILPDFCLTWVITLRDYWFQTGDTSLFAEQKKQAEANLAYFEHMRDANGLVPYDPRFWLFCDWSTLPKRNYPAFINLWHIYAREQYLQVLSAAGPAAEAEALAAAIRREKETVSAAFFDPETGLFSPESDGAGERAGAPSVHDQVLALLLGLHPEAKDAMICKIVRPCLLDELEGSALPSSFWASYLLDCAAKNGLRKEGLDYIERNWKPMIPSGTVWENFPDRGQQELSFAHAWSAHPVTHLPELCFGLEQTAPAWKELRLEPLFYPGRAEFRLPLPQGMLSGKISGTAEAFTAEFVIPEGVKATIVLPEETVTASGETVRRTASEEGR